VPLQRRQGVARGFMCWPVNRGGHSRSLVFWLGRIYVENGGFGCTLDVSTLSSSFRAIDGDKPAYRRATFDTFAECVAAGQSQIDSQRSTSPNITWQCIGE
jgi:hypothetical protein